MRLTGQMRLFFTSRLGILARNASILFGGNTIASLMGILSTVLAARALGVDEFGKLTLVIVFVAVVDRIINFQSWQAIIKFCSKGDVSNTRRDNEILSLGFKVDCIAAIVGLAVAFIIISFSRIIVDYSKDELVSAIIYAGTLIFRISGAPTAYLRIRSRFVLLSSLQAVMGLFKVLLTLLAAFGSAGLIGFTVAWAISEILSGFALLFFFYREKKTSEGGFGIDIKSVVEVRLKDNVEILRFMITSNMHATVKFFLREFDLIFIGVVLGSAQVGIYKVIKSIGTVAVRFSDPFYQAIYPDMVEMVKESKYQEFRSYILGSIKLVGIFSILFLAAYFGFGEHIIIVMLGEDYREVFSPGGIYLFASMIGMITFAFHPAMMALNKAGTSLNILVFSSVLYVLLFSVVVPLYGLNGAASSYLFFYLLWASLQIIFLVQIVKNERKISATE